MQAHTYTLAHACTCTHKHVHKCTCTHKHNYNAYVRTCTCMHNHIWWCTDLYLYTHLCLSVAFVLVEKVLQSSSRYVCSASCRVSVWVLPGVESRNTCCTNLLTFSSTSWSRRRPWRSADEGLRYWWTNKQGIFMSSSWLPSSRSCVCKFLQGNPCICYQKYFDNPMNFLVQFQPSCTSLKVIVSLGAYHFVTEDLVTIDIGQAYDFLDSRCTANIQ